MCAARPHGPGEAFSRARRETRPVYSLGAAATGVTMKKRSSSKGAGSGSVARSRRNSSRRNDGARDRNVGKG